MKDEVELPGGGKWKNTVLIDGKRKVAETLDEYRDQCKATLMGQECPRLNAMCPIFLAVGRPRGLNNRSLSKDLPDRSSGTPSTLLAGRAPAPSTR